MNNWQYHLELAHYEAQYRQHLAQQHRLVKLAPPTGPRRMLAHAWLRVVRILRRYRKRMFGGTTAHSDAVDASQIAPLAH